MIMKMDVLLIEETQDVPHYYCRFVVLAQAEGKYTEIRCLDFVN